MIKVRSSSTVDRDLGHDKIVKELAGLVGARVEVGLFEGEGGYSESELTVPQIGAVHEFGTRDGHVPERSWLRRSHDENVQRIIAMFDNLVSAVIGARTKLSVALALTGIGERIASFARKTITLVDSPPLAESTLKKKGRDKANPLIDTGTMRNNVRSRIRLR